MARWLHRSLFLMLAVPVVIGGNTGVMAARGRAGETPGPLQQDARVVFSEWAGHSTHRPFLVTGSVHNLWPGTPQPLRLTVRNFNREPIHLLTLGVSADNPHGCVARRNLRITDYNWRRPGARQYTAPGSGSVVVPLQITLLDIPGNQRFCEGVTFHLIYRGNAEGAEGRG